MALPVPISFDHLEGGDTRAMVDYLNGIRYAIGSLSAGDASDVAARAKLAQKYAAIHKAAKEISHAAYRLEVAALRRIGELGFADTCKSLRSEERNAAKLFATFTDEQLDGLIEDYPRLGSAISLKRAIENAEKERATWATMRAWRDDGEGAELDSTDPYWASHSVSDAVETLMANADANRPFTVEQLADKVIQVIQPDEEQADSFMRRAVRGFVRDALSRAIGSEDETMSSQGDLSNCPKIVTYHSQDAGWIRIPFLTATLAQLRWFVEMREWQAEKLTRKAEDLRALLVKIEGAPHMKDTSVCKRAFHMTTGNLRSQEAEPTRRPVRPTRSDVA